MYVVRKIRYVHVCVREREEKKKEERKRSEMRGRGWEEEKENGVMLCVCTRACVRVCARGGVGRGGVGRHSQF